MGLAWTVCVWRDVAGRRNLGFSRPANECHKPNEMNEYQNEYQNE